MDGGGYSYIIPSKRSNVYVFQQQLDVYMQYEVFDGEDRVTEPYTIRVNKPAGAN
jgi:hypothetical protein